MSWFKNLLPSKRIRVKDSGKKSIPEGVWTKCNHCQAVLYSAELQRNLSVCPKCHFHMRIGARQRLDIFLDEEDRIEIAPHLKPADPLRFRDSKKYRDRVSQAQKKTGEKDAFIAMRGSVEGVPVIAAAFEFGYMGGSMGSVVGEKFVRAAQAAMEYSLPLVCFTASGGARMQESLFSLMQMSKTSAVLAKMHQKRLPYIVVLTDPTMGGVSASHAMLGDIHLAEPNALIGFAGPRVIEQTVKQVLPEGFQRSEFLLEHGAIDQVVERKNLRSSIASMLRLMLPIKDSTDPLHEEYH